MPYNQDKTRGNANDRDLPHGISLSCCYFQPILICLCLILSFSASATEPFEYGYCGENITGIGLKKSGQWIGAAIKIPKSEISRLGITTVSGLSIGLGKGEYDIVYTFLSYDLSQEPSYVNPVKIAQRPGWNQVKFPQPIEIDSEHDVYAGYYLKTASDQDVPIGMDGLERPVEWSDYIGYSAERERLWEYFISQKGRFGNACIRALVSGSSLPEDKGEISKVTFPLFMHPGEPINSELLIKNNGANAIKTLALEYKIGSDTSNLVNSTLTSPITANESGKSQLKLFTNQEGWNLPLTIKLKAINGKEVTSPSSYETEIVIAEKSFERKVIVEEGTSLNCGRAPIGYVGIKKLTQIINDSSLIILSYHNSLDGYDVLSNQATENWATAVNFKTNPSAILNRDKKLGFQVPTCFNLYSDYELKHKATFAEINGKAQAEEGRKYAIKAEVRVAKDCLNQGMILELVLSEDKLGPYKQKNDFSGKPQSDLAPGFEELAPYCDLTFENVVRWRYVIVRENFLPYGLKNGDVFRWNGKIDIPTYVKMENSHLTLLLIDDETGQVINGRQIDLPEFSGVMELTDDIASEMEIYDIAGRKCSKSFRDLRKGIYLTIRKNSRGEKVCQKVAN